MALLLCRQPRTLRTAEGGILRLGRTSFVGGQEDFTSKAPVSASTSTLTAIYGAPGSSYSTMRSTSPLVSPYRGFSGSSRPFTTGDASRSLISSARATGVVSPTRVRSRAFSQGMLGGLGADPTDRFDQFNMRGGGFNFM
jgi:hypothetical protein